MKEWAVFTQDGEHQLHSGPSREHGAAGHSQDFYTSARHALRFLSFIFLSRCWGGWKATEADTLVGG